MEKYFSEYIRNLLIDSVDCLSGTHSRFIFLYWVLGSQYYVKKINLEEAPRLQISTCVSNICQLMLIFTKTLIRLSGAVQRVIITC